MCYYSHNDGEQVSFRLAWCKMTDLNTYIPFMRFLSSFLGRHAEIVLYDTREVIYIENPLTTFRKVGDKLGDAELKFLNEKFYERVDYITNYRSLSQDSQKLRSATYFIKNQKKELVGILTINYSVNHLLEMREIIDVLINGFERRESGRGYHEPHFFEVFNGSFGDLMASSIKEMVNKYDVPPERLTLEEKMQIIRALEAKGVFLIKGSVVEVAKALKSSEATIYRYLSQL